jgi:hypothetical protein
MPLVSVQFQMHPVEAGMLPVKTLFEFGFEILNQERDRRDHLPAQKETKCQAQKTVNGVP